MLGPSGPWPLGVGAVSRNDDRIAALPHIECSRTLRLLQLTAFLVLLAPSATFAQADERVIYASVVDRDGAPVPDLTVSDFIVREDDVEREVLRVTRDTDPMQLALLVDNSTAARNQIGELRRALSAFFRRLREGPEVALIGLAERPTIVVDYTTDRSVLLKNVNLIFAPAAEGSTLLDAIAETSQGFGRRPEVRSVIVAIVTEGPDLSHRYYTDVLEALQEGGAALHAIVLKTGGAGGDLSVRTVLDTGTKQSGGRYEEVLAASALEAKLDQLASELSNQYRVVFARPPQLIPPSTTTISVRQPELRARGMLMKTDAER